MKEKIDINEIKIRRKYTRKIGNWIERNKKKYDRKRDKKSYEYKAR